jgi:Domain of unknown function (DUF5666)
MFGKRPPGQGEVRKSAGHERPSIVIFLLSMLYIAGCGSNTTSGANAAATLTATSCQHAVNSDIHAVTGTLQGMHGTALTILDTARRSIQVSYTNATVFDQEKLLTSTDLHDGLSVLVEVIQNPDHSYTAREINIREQRDASQGSGVKKELQGCPANPSGAPGKPSTGKDAGDPQKGSDPGSQPANTAAKGVSGTISQMSGNKITVTDTNGDDYTIGLTAQTQIIHIARVTPAALKIGGWLSALGTRNSANVITASAITLLLHAPAASKHA